MTAGRNALTRLAMVTIALVALAAVTARADGKTLTFEDLMKFVTLHDTVISDDGAWIAYALRPGRGDGEVVVRATASDAEYRVERGKAPKISSDSRWVSMGIEPPVEKVEAAKNGDDKPKPDLALLDTRDGTVTHFARVEAFSFSKDSRWLAYKHFAEEKVEDESDDETKDLGTTLVLRDLDLGLSSEISHATRFAFDETGKYLAYAMASPEVTENGLFLRALTVTGGPDEGIRQDENGRYTALKWAKGQSRLGFVAAVDGEDGEPGPSDLMVWDGEAKKTSAWSDVADGWFIPSTNKLTWSDDGKRLFFGLKPAVPETEPEEDKPFDPYDREALLAESEVDVWHWNDPLIIPHQKKQWKDEKDRTYQAVYHLESDRVVPLADREMRNVEPAKRSGQVLGLADVGYLKRLTWEGRFQDVYVVNLADGARKTVIEEQQHTTSLSPDGRFVAYYKEQNWHLFDVETGSHRHLTAGLDVPFYNEDHDYPSDVPGYGLGGWSEGDGSLLVYDKYDVWQFPTGGGKPLNLTGGQGRDKKYTFRVIDLDKEVDFIGGDGTLLLSAYQHERKNWGFYRARLGASGIERLLEEDKKFSFLAKAKDSDRILYTRESYGEFPDIWMTDLSFEARAKLSEANPQIAEFAWGDAELVEWASLDGTPLQGVLIKPGNYEAGKRYPVLVYFYRFFSQRLTEFNEPLINHRPSFPIYASDGYAVFLPDVRFEVGRPGFAATKCLVPGVQKLIDMGIADPNAIGLHGHSWSGYQTAFVITQTDLFAAAVAGAPVSNMTSAYSGIRWASGMARQFQYEQTQSRIGGSLWEYPERYIENSPVFFADRINTPLLTMFGDEDGAVPWYQGIELYLAMRRLGKENIFLQYRGEPHHPQKYSNKLDYSIKMKEFLDHHLKGLPAPEWMTEGVAYQGK